MKKHVHLKKRSNGRERKESSYRERIASMNLPNSRKKKNEGMIRTLKVLNQFENVNKEQFFEI